MSTAFLLAVARHLRGAAGLKRCHTYDGAARKDALFDEAPYRNTACACLEQSIEALQLSECCTSLAKHVTVYGKRAEAHGHNVDHNA